MILNFNRWKTVIWIISELIVNTDHVIKSFFCVNNSTIQTNSVYGSEQFVFHFVHSRVLVGLWLNMKNSFVLSEA